QRLLDLGGEQAIGTDGHEHVGGLNADLEVLEVQLVEMIDMAQRRLQQGFGGWLAVLLLQVLLQRTGVDADADRDAVVTRRVDHRADAILTADVTGVDAQAINAQVSHPQGDLVIEMDVRHQRHVDLLADFAKGFGGLHTRHGYADDVGTDGFQLANLRDRGRHVAGLGIGHALHRNGCIAANQHRAHADLTGLSAYDRGLLMHCVTSYWPSRSRATPELALAWSSTGCPLYSIVATALAAPITSSSGPWRSTFSVWPGCIWPLCNTRPAALTCTQQLPEKVMTSPPWLAAAGAAEGAGAAAGALGAAVDGDAGAAGAGCTGADAAVSPAVAGSAGWAAGLSPASAAGTVASAAGSPRVSSVTGAPAFGSLSKDEVRL